MVATSLRWSTFACCCWAGVVLAADPKPAEPQPKESPAAKLASIDAQIVEAPDDPMLHYQRAQLLSKLQKFDDGYAAAQLAMAKFVKANKSLAWLALDNLEVDGHGVMVLFNMGPDERQPPADGLIRPLTFRIFNKDGTAIVDAFDFEIGYIGGKPTTGCFGKTLPEGHLNLGAVDPATPYSQVRPAAMKLTESLVKKKK